MRSVERGSRVSDSLVSLVRGRLDVSVDGAPGASVDPVHGAHGDQGDHGVSDDPVQGSQDISDDPSDGDQDVTGS